MARIRFLALLALSLTAFAALAAPQTFNVPTPAKSVPVPASSVMDPAATVPVSVTVPSGCTATQTGSAIAVACSSGPTPPPAGCTAAFCLTSVKVSAATVAAGGSVTVNASVTAAATAANQTIDVEVLDPSGNKLPACQNWQTGVSFTAQQAVAAPALTCAIPARSPAGTYGVFVGTFSPAPANALLWQAKPAANFAVTGGVTPPPPPTTGPLTTPAALLQYLVGLKGQPKHVLIGQFGNHYDANNFLDNWTPLSPSPAILGMWLDVPWAVPDAQQIAAANAHLAKGGIVQVSLASGVTNGLASLDATTPVGSQVLNWKNMATAGTPDYNAWVSYLQSYVAPALKQFNGPVLFRPFVECNGNWEGAYYTTDTASFIKVWQIMVATLKAAGATNVLYEYNINAGVGGYNDRYAGAAFVDVVSEDAYPPGANDEAYAAIATLGKPVMIAETGADIAASSFPVNTFDNYSILKTVVASYPSAVAVMYWCQQLGLLLQQGGATPLSNSPPTLADPAAITLPQLPH